MREIHKFCTLIKDLANAGAPVNSGSLTNEFIGSCKMLWMFLSRLTVRFHLLIFRLGQSSSENSSRKPSNVGTVLLLQVRTVS